MSQLERIERHPKCTEVEKELVKLRKAGWLGRPGGHWWVVFCPFECNCWFTIGGTPKDCGSLARHVRREARKCKGA